MRDKITEPMSAFLDHLSQSVIPTVYGDFTFHVFAEPERAKEHLALTLGALRAPAPPLVRVHSECITGEAFGSLKCDCGAQLAGAMRRLVEDGRGILIYLRQEGRGIGLAEKIRAYALQADGYDTVEANRLLGFPPDCRRYEIAAEILRTFGVGAIRLLTNNQDKIDQLTAAGLKVTREPLVITPGPYNLDYLRAKKEKMGHLLPDAVFHGTGLPTPDAE